ncbi:hemolysin III family protein [Massilia sp. Dwa41.01b]|uniref:PAQR family membrane homeostasis protein TrhA n=1 Tax=unclassified Massilia TaxID=2609279 RepID=UPI00160187F5|nr:MULTISPECIES: hemolysin III family protein [unclassified Massilia]QNA89414.1 hemolysin III family protein [Massilia sp. Dwa41.01b]QNB00314.1 hemolysin III family protein [Massilia sp. Se16.2.3]
MQHGEKLNTLTHLAGAVLAAAASAPLIARALEGSGVAGAVSTAVYAVSLVLMYACSSAYHWASGSLKELLRRFDHLSIYLLIAGSYTPFCMLLLGGREGWILLAVVWGLAVFGVLQESRPRGGARVLSMLIYLGMGWAAAFILGTLHARLGPAGFAWLLGGGLAYTAGIIFYVLDARLKHAHGIWHLFVLAGSAAHYVTIYRYVL